MLLSLFQGNVDEGVRGLAIALKHYGVRVWRPGSDAFSWASKEITTSPPSSPSSPLLWQRTSSSMWSWGCLPGRCFVSSLRRIHSTSLG